LKGIDIDLSGSSDSAREAGAWGREGEGQLAGGVLGLIDEGNIESEERIDVVVGGGLRDGAGVLSSVGSIRLSFLDGDDQVGEQGCLGTFVVGGGLAGSAVGGSGGADIDSHRRGMVWRRGRIDSDGSGDGRRRWRRGQSGGDGGGGNEGLLGNADVVDADSFPRISATAVGILLAANWRGRGKSGGSRSACAGRLLDADVVLADCGPGIATIAILVSHATDRGRWNRR
jgi:hypothetical protein